MKLFEIDERKLLLELICEKQIEFLVKNPDDFISEKYVKLEKLKAKINDM